MTMVNVAVVSITLSLRVAYAHKTGFHIYKRLVILSLELLLLTFRSQRFSCLVLSLIIRCLFYFGCLSEFGA